MNRQVPLSSATMQSPPSPTPNLPPATLSLVTVILLLLLLVCAFFILKWVYQWVHYKVEEWRFAPVRAYQQQQQQIPPPEGAYSPPSPNTYYPQQQQQVYQRR